MANSQKLRFFALLFLTPFMFKFKNMESIQTFEPLTQELDGQFAAFLVLAVVVAIALYFYNRKEIPYERRTQRQMISMLGFFVILISIGSAFFSWLTTYKLRTVSISKEAIETPYGIAEIDNIRTTYFYMDEQKARFGNTVLDTTRFLIIEEYGKKSHALSEENYDIWKIRKVLLDLTREED